MYFDNLEKYTDYILKITPSTEKGFSDTYTAQLHIKTEEDGRLDPFIAYKQIVAVLLFIMLSDRKHSYNYIKSVCSQIISLSINIANSILFKIHYLLIKLSPIIIIKASSF